MINSLLADYKINIEKHIDSIFPMLNNEYAIVTEASRYSLLLGGKRIRPVIMLEFAKLFGCNSKAVLDFSVALEMIHTYSLIHDDLPCMDNDDLRRGKPSCHKKFGEDIALLAGDTLLTESFNIAANADFNSDLKIKAIAILAKRAGLHGMIGGQVMDLSFEKCTPNAETLQKMCLKKTGALLSAAAEIGCILGGADENTVNIASQYALNVGLAFQIIDDILDVTSTEDVLGKPIGSDADNNKTTYVTLLGLEKAKQLAGELTEKAINLLKEFNGDTSNLEELTKYLLNRNF